MNYLSSGWKMVWRRMAVARSRSALLTLSDETLKDIGLSRSDIESISVDLVDGRVDKTWRARGR